LFPQVYANCDVCGKDLVVFDIRKRIGLQFLNDPVDIMLMAVFLQRAQENDVVLGAHCKYFIVRKMGEQPKQGYVPFAAQAEQHGRVLRYMIVKQKFRKARKIMEGFEYGQFLGVVLHFLKN
jgi:hypothetical protein